MDNIPPWGELSGVKEVYDIDVFDTNKASLPSHANDPTHDIFDICKGVVDGTPCGQPAKYTIQVTAFIPFDNLDDPQNPGPGHDYVYEGDAPGAHPPNPGRGPSLRSPRFRMRQRITVIPIQAQDPDGYLEGSYAEPVKITKRYEKYSSLDANGDLTDLARSDTDKDDNYLLHQSDYSDTENEHYVDRVDANTVWVRLKGSGPNPLESLAPAIDWDITFTITKLPASPAHYTVTGHGPPPLAHDAFPAYDVFINDELIHYHNASPFNPLDLFNPFDISLSISCDEGNC
jgi:hypothetical protein